MRQFRPVVLVSIRRYRDLSGVVEMIAGSSAAFVQLCDELHITLSLSLTHTHTHTSEDPDSWSVVVTTQTQHQKVCHPDFL